MKDHQRYIDQLNEKQIAKTRQISKMQAEYNTLIKKSK